MLLRPFNRFGGNGSKRRNNSRKKLGVCEREIAYVLYKIKLIVYVLSYDLIAMGYYRKNGV
jgi:hypothetical protein